MRPDRRVELASVELAFIAGSYPAMALSSNDPRGRVTEFVVGAGFAGCAFAGLALRSKRLLAGGLIAHAAWDFAHHVGRPGTDAPSWYPLFCLLADLLLAQPLLGSPDDGLHG
jgi:membrane protease YdiL (CAAX protease family)